MDSIIRILAERVVSQIAAGEVIDRPASVVRELIDNSVDAGADRIVVRFERGGKGLIKVSDNGMGMSRDDLLLCVERHATSKIETADDLLSVRSMGFRGEALSSIASISRMRIISRPKDELMGHKLTISGGKFGSIEETGTPSGTIIEVRDIFYNIPARRKFLRGERVEAGHIIDVLSRAALPLADIGFKLEDGGKTVISLSPSAQHLSRLSALMGRKVARSMIDVQEEGHGMAIKAYLAPSDLARSRGDRLFFYVNGRNIRDRLITKAVMEGYGQRLMKGRYPQAVIFIEINPSEVDVNVHPAKQEVRFRNGNVVFDTIASTVEKAMDQSSHAFFASIQGKEKSNLAQRAPYRYVSEPAWEYSKRTREITPPAGTEKREEPMLREGPQIIGQLGNTYILCQTEDGLLLVDQHAAHERVVYEHLKNGLLSSQIEVQNLLIPHKIELTMKEGGIVLKKGEKLSRFGIQLEHFGGNSFMLRAVPVLLGDVKWEPFLSELVSRLEEGELEDEAVLDKVLTVMACHSAIRAGRHMSREEMVHLLSQLEEMDLPTNCPHGRPIFKQFTYYEIEKMFKRVV